MSRGKSPEIEQVTMRYADGVGRAGNVQGNYGMISDQQFLVTADKMIFDLVKTEIW